MNKSYIAAVGLGLIVALTLWALPSIAGTDQDEIAKANAQIQQISGQCVAALHQADSSGDMDNIAANCDTDIAQVLADLMSELGYEPFYTTSKTYVTNERVGYTVCFDPIHIGGSGG